MMLGLFLKYNKKELWRKSRTHREQACIYSRLLPSSSVSSLCDGLQTVPCHESQSPDLRVVGSPHTSKMLLVNANIYDHRPLMQDNFIRQPYQAKWALAFLGRGGGNQDKMSPDYHHVYILLYGSCQHSTCSVVPHSCVEQKR